MNNHGPTLEFSSLFSSHKRPFLIQGETIQLTFVLSVEGDREHVLEKDFYWDLEHFELEGQSFYTRNEMIPIDSPLVVQRGKMHTVDEPQHRAFPLSVYIRPSAKFSSSVASLRVKLIDYSRLQKTVPDHLAQLGDAFCDLLRIDRHEYEDLIVKSASASQLNRIGQTLSISVPIISALCVGIQLKKSGSGHRFVQLTITSHKYIDCVAITDVSAAWKSDSQFFWDKPIGDVLRLEPVSPHKPASLAPGESLSLLYSFQVASSDAGSSMTGAVTLRLETTIVFTINESAEAFSLSFEKQFEFGDLK